MPHLRRSATPRPGRGRRLVRWLAALLLVLLVSLAWAGWQAWQGAQTLQAAADGVRTVQGDLGGPGDIDERLEGIAEQTGRARERFEDPLVRALAAVPRLGEPVAAALAVSRAADVTVAQGLRPLVTAAGDDPAGRLTSGPGAVDVGYLASLAPPAAEASRALDTAAAHLAEAPQDSYVQRVDSAVRDFEEDLGRLRERLADVALALDVAPQLLGQGGTRRYLVISQSPAEARGTGGLIGGYSLLEASDGALRIVGSGSKSDLQSPNEPVEYLTEEFDQHYDANGATTGWINSNLSPHFPYAARIWMKLWERQHGEQLDGALALDPIALSHLLRATGPVPLPDGTQATADNVADLTMRVVYERFGGSPAGDVFLQQISDGVATALITREVDARALVEGLAEAVGQRRLLLWSADEQAQAKLAGQDISGSLPEGERAVGDVIVDAAGSKLDYYLERDLRYTEGCGRDSALALTLTNAAPADGLPEYVSPPPFRRGGPPGTNVMLATLYLPPDSRVTGVTLGGQDVFFRQGTELGLVWVEVLVTLPPGQRTELTATFTEPEGPRGPLERVHQPLVREESFTALTC